MVSGACEGISLGGGTPFGTGGDASGSEDVPIPDKLVGKSSETTYWAIIRNDGRSVGLRLQAGSSAASSSLILQLAMVQCI